MTPSVRHPPTPRAQSPTRCLLPPPWGPVGQHLGPRGWGESEGHCTDMLRFSRCVTQRRVSRVCHERKAGECCVRKAFSVKTSESQLGEDTCHTPAKPKSRADGVGGGSPRPLGQGPQSHGRDAPITRMWVSGCGHVHRETGPAQGQAWPGGARGRPQRPAGLRNRPLWPQVEKTPQQGQWCRCI